jgi:hypothetical protein
MAKVSPWHSVRPNDPLVYHDNTNCTEGNNIEPKNRREGTGSRKKCAHCTRLA